MASLTFYEGHAKLGSRVIPLETAVLRSQMEEAESRENVQLSCAALDRPFSMAFTSSRFLLFFCHGTEELSDPPPPPPPQVFSNWRLLTLSRVASQGLIQSHIAWLGTQSTLQKFSVEIG